MDDVFERIGNYEANSSTNIYELLEIESYDQRSVDTDTDIKNFAVTDTDADTDIKNFETADTDDITECQNQRASCSGTNEGFNIYAKVGFSGN